MNGKNLTYRSAGVDIEAGEMLIKRIKPAAARTRRPGVLTDLGGFGGLFEIPVDRYQNPVLVSGTDGVGTKLKLAIKYDRHAGVGIDLVAMCVNDIVVTGAEPLFFLDYYATGRLDVDVAGAVIEGIAKGCEQAGAALIGGETAEMPGMYSDTDYDLAGFAVGIVEKNGIIDGSAVADGDVLIGLRSSGPHSNGYSLIRKVLDEAAAAPDQVDIEGTDLLSALLAPTRIFVKPILGLLESVPVKAIAHVTGGGITENLPRVLADGFGADIALSAWEMPGLFRWLQQQGNIKSDEMLRTFNCGIGMIIGVAPDMASSAMSHLAASNEDPVEIGTVTSKHVGVRYRS